MKFPPMPICCCLIIFLAACTGSYGRVQRSNDVGKAFEQNELLADHAYHTAGPEARPTAILAINNTYSLKPGLWRPVDMTADLLKQLVNAMTDQLGFTPATLGGLITDSQGQQVGVWYSRYSRTTIRFETDKVIVISLPSPDEGSSSINIHNRPGRLR